MSHLPPASLDWFRDRPRAPFYCEENVWLLCRDAADVARVSAVVITNASGAVAMWAQRAAAVDPIVWDYHVVAIVDDATTGAWVVDSDCRAGTILSLADWLEASFRAGVRDDVMPMFRVIPAAVYRDVLASDRRHMRDVDGRPTRPFPPWPPPHPDRDNTLGRLIDVDDDIAGVVVDIVGLARHFTLSPVTLPPLESP